MIAVLFVFLGMYYAFPTFSEKGWLGHRTVGIGRAEGGEIPERPGEMLSPVLINFRPFEILLAIKLTACCAISKVRAVS